MIHPLFALVAAPLLLPPAHSCRTPRVQAAPERAAQPTEDSPETPPKEGSRVAWGNGVELMRAELHPVLVKRYAMTGEGRSALTHLLKTRLLERMAVERHMEVGDEALDRRIEELNRQMRAAGETGDVLSNLRANNIDEAEFRRLLRFSIVQERLCREALGIAPDQPVSKGQQDLWIDEELKARGVEAPAPPWSNGIAGRCGDAIVTAEEYEAELVLSLDPEAVRETCYQMLVAKALRARMPDISDETYDKSLTLEIERRRIQAESNPAYRGASFEHLLSTQGMTIELLRTDPAVQVTALSQLWILRSHSDDALRAAYDEERALFDGTFGEALRTRVIFLRAAEVGTPKNPRLYDQAVAQLEELARDIHSESEFEAAARRHSEDSKTRTNGGELGWLSRVGTGLGELRSAAFEHLKRSGPLPEGGRIMPPIRNATGVVLLWLSEHRPAPTWETMRGHVRDTLRKRFLVEVLPRESMVTILDA